MKTLLASSVAAMIAAASGAGSSLSPTAPAAAAEASAGSPPPSKVSSAADDTAIRPFRVSIPDAKLSELRRRILATQWPEKETVTDDSQGVPLATMQEL